MKWLTRFAGELYSGPRSDSGVPTNERLKTFILENDFKIDKIDSILFSKTKKHAILIVQIYVDDIIFGSTNIFLYKEFFECMCRKFDMSMMGEISLFLGFQIK